MIPLYIKSWQISHSHINKMPAVTQHANETDNIAYHVIMQEVYDWAGSLDDLPLHFTLHRRQHVVLHSDPLQGHEVLDVREGVSCSSYNETKNTLPTPTCTLTLAHQHFLFHDSS